MLIIQQKNTKYTWKFIKATPPNAHKHHKMTIFDKNPPLLKFQKINTEATLDFDLKIRITVAGERETRHCPVKVIFSKVPRFSVDLGTTYSCIAYINPNKEINIVQINTREQKDYCIPTAIYFPTDQNETKVGYEALEYLST
eukprot:133575_1